MNQQELEKNVFGIDVIANEKNNKKTKQKRKNNEISTNIEEEKDMNELNASTPSIWKDQDDEEIVIDLNSKDRLKKLKLDLINNDTNTKNTNKDIISSEVFSSLLKNKFEKNKHDWSNIQKNKQNKNKNKLNSMLTTQDNILEKTKITSLQPNKINLSRSIDGNISSNHKNTVVINSIKFHPQRNDLLLTATSKKMIHLYRIDHKNNEIELNLKFPDMNISYADFLCKANNHNNSATNTATKDTTEIIVAGRKPYFYTYDMVTGVIDKHTCLQNRDINSLEHMTVSPNHQYIAIAGKSGYIHMLDAGRKTHLFDVKMNTGVRSVCFQDEYIMKTGGVDGHVYTWDMRYNGRCVSNVLNEDGTCISSLVSGKNIYTNETLTAVGSESGVVTLYKDNVVSKSIMNLTNEINSMSLHATGKLLAIGSDKVRDELRLVHTDTGTVYNNWPTDKTPLRRVQCIEFSPYVSNGNNYICIGNNVGKVLIYNINHTL